LSLPRPKISYRLDEYTLRGFASARRTCSAIYRSIGATEFTDFSDKQYLAGYFEYNGESYASFGPGHLMGTNPMRYAVFQSASGPTRAACIMRSRRSGRLYGFGFIGLTKTLTTTDMTSENWVSQSEPRSSIRAQPYRTT
jgi:hypothetical protein